MSEINGKTTEARPRKFVFNGMQLADPDPKMTPQKVAEFHSLLHAEDTMTTNSSHRSELSDEKRENQNRKHETPVPALHPGTGNKKQT